VRRCILSKKVGLTRRQLEEYNHILHGWGPDYYPFNSRACYWNRCYYSNQSANGWAALFFARRWKSRNINIRKLQQVVIASGDPRCAYEFARDVPEANIKKIQDMIVNSGNPEIIHKFAHDIKGADKQMLENALIIAEVLGV
jgi:hypothetical protein